MTRCFPYIPSLSLVHTSNNVEATFDFVAKNFDIALTLLLVWTGL